MAEQYNSTKQYKYNKYEWAVKIRPYFKNMLQF